MIIKFLIYTGARKVTKEEKALAIAKKEFEIGNVQENIINENELIEYYTSYNGLMPIIFRIIRSKLYFIEFDIDCINLYKCSNYKREPIDSWDYYNNPSTPELDALLDAVYYVLCEANNENQS